MPTSRIPGFHKLTVEQRLAALIEHGGVSSEDADVYRHGALDLGTAAHMVENTISTYELPNAVAMNLLINGEDRLVPMVVEEPSVVAAVSNMARVIRLSGGLTAEADDSVMIGQVQLMHVRDPERVASQLNAHLVELIEIARKVHPRLEERGGGVRGMYVRKLHYDEPGYPVEHMVVLQFLLDCVDAMGANMINTVAEALAPHVELITGETVGLRILSNLASYRLGRAWCAIDPAHLATDTLSGEEVAHGIASAWRFAWADPYRAATHNKGVMNGVDAVAVATGNDWRALEAGAHAWCARDHGPYRPMTTWRVQDDGRLHGFIEIPTQFGTVGGPLRVHPKAQANLRLMGCRGARDLAAIAVSVGLVQNLGALRALATDGIQAGHMRMHARTVAAGVGATPAEIPEIVVRLCALKDFSDDAARAALAALRAGLPSRLTSDVEGDA
jgi:hydroxymethylglutaryl-CoA reductase